MPETDADERQEYSGHTNLQVRVEHGRTDGSTDEEAKENLRSMSREAEETLKDLLDETELEAKVHSPVLTFEEMEQ